MVVNFCSASNSLENTNTEMFRLLQKSQSLVGGPKLTSSFFEHIWSERILYNASNIQRNLCSSSNNNNPDNLPHLPLPPLENTLNRYLKTVEPVLTSQELQNTKTVVENFKKGIGSKLQELLQKKAKISENWLSDWWLNSAYLTYRDPVVLFSSPGLAFPKQNFANESERNLYAARVISAALMYKDMVDHKKIPQEKAGKALLDMGQYNKIFGTCRIPGLEKDSLSFNSNSKHFVLFYNNNIFKVTVYGNDGSTIISEKQLTDQINETIRNGNEPGIPIGLLTSDNRNNWSVAYNILMKDSKNKKSLNIIQSALFVLSIDKQMPSQGREDHKITASHQLIHGGGSKFNTGNRWFDKTIQFVIGNTGINGLTYEHSPAEGQPIARMTDYIVNYVNQKKTVNSNDVGSIPRPEKLEFNISNELNDCFGKAADNIDKIVENLQMECLHFKGYGKDFIKKQKMSPDSFLQIGMQYAFYRFHKEPAAHYESAQTRMFIHGRTETIRSCSNESVAFAKAMTENKLKDDERAKLLFEAVKAHKDYSSLAMQGLGVDRHLLGLKLTALENKMPIPELYKDAGFVKSTHMRLSTSQVASEYEAFMIYGPLVDNGYGCCYNPRNNDIFFGISSFKNCPVTDSKMFAVCLKECLCEMQELLQRTSGVNLKSKL